MSTLINPRGPLPQRVYWVRRALLAGIVAVLAVLAWWLLPIGGGHQAVGQSSPPHHHRSGVSTQPAAGKGEDPAATLRRHGVPTTGPTTGESRTSSTSRGTSPAGGSSSHSSPSGSSGSTAPALTPHGRCDPASLHLAVDTTPMKAGAATTIGLSIWTGGAPACSLALSPQLLEARITTGDATFWQSATCPDELPARNVVVGPTKTQVYAFRWDGRSDDDACSGGQVAPTGPYVVQAALIGGNPANARLMIGS